MDKPRLEKPIVSSEKQEISVPETHTTESRQELEGLIAHEATETEEAIQKITRQLQASQEPTAELSATQQEEKIQKYQEKHLPKHLRKNLQSGSLFGKALNLFLERKTEKHGLENLPEKGPFLVVSNHFGADSEHLAALLKDFDTHIAASKTIHWERSPIRRWSLEKIRAIITPESLAHLSDGEKNALIERMPDGFNKTQYQKILAREKEAPESDMGTRLDFIRNSVALLSRGDVIVVFPEGLWLYEGGDDLPRAQTMYRGYEGIEIIAKQFERLTGKELPIVPITIHTDKDKKKIIDIGTPLILSKNESGLSDVDWCMAHIAQSLPEEQRGYYSKIAEQLPNTKA